MCYDDPLKQFCTKLNCVQLQFVSLNFVTLYSVPRTFNTLHCVKKTRYSALCYIAPSNVKICNTPLDKNALCSSAL